MTYQDFVRIYGDAIYKEFTTENVYDILGLNYDQYVRMKYENFLEDFPQHKPKQPQREVPENWRELEQDFQDAVLWGEQE